MTNSNDTETRHPDLATVVFDAVGFCLKSLLGPRGQGLGRPVPSDVRQALADLQGDVDPGFGCCSGQAFGIAEQQLGRACLDQQRRKPGQ